MSFRAQIRFRNASTQVESLDNKEMFISVPKQSKISDKVALVIGGTTEINEIFGKDLLENGVKVCSI